MRKVRAVAYYRVSTRCQGASGLGLDAQREAVRVCLSGNGWPPVAEFTEVESGGKNDRPELARALAACKLYGAVLVVAKLDRLVRNVAFVSALMEIGVDFVAVDFPMASRLTVHILAAVAEHEASMNSARTKAALAAAKARGRVLGGFRGYRLTAQDGAQAVAAKRLRAAERAEWIAPLLAELRAAGVASLRAVAAEFNRRAVPAPRGGAWHPNTVRQLLRTASV